MATKGKAKPAQADVQDLGQIGENIQAYMRGTHLILDIDTAVTLGTSGTGKSESIAKSGMFAQIQGMLLNLNLNRPIKRQQATRPAGNGRAAEMANLIASFG